MVAAHTGAATNVGDGPEDKRPPSAAASPERKRASALSRCVQPSGGARADCPGARRNNPACTLTGVSLPASGRGVVEAVGGLYGFVRALKGGG
jgi:hypothetical protein